MPHPSSVPRSVSLEAQCRLLNRLLWAWAAAGGALAVAALSY
ncbi:hypothetical protein [Hymenobacter sp. 15J16-1T3B]|nr:hypothetical protein [Hymenobacter sp. 15J16-1T3B]